MEFKFKVIILGDYSCGKTAILKRLKNESFFNDYSSTIGVDYFRKTFNHTDLLNDTTNLDDGKNMFEITQEDKLLKAKPKNSIFKKYHSVNKKISRNNVSYIANIWDTSGQEQFSNITSAYYRNITSAIFVFDLSNYTSFISLTKWHSKLFEKLDEHAHAYFPFVVVGNKSDLKSLRTISFKKANEFVTKLGGVYIETSAKNNINIELIFSFLIRKILFNINNELVIPSSKNGITVTNFRQDLFPEKRDNLNEDDITYRCCLIM